MSTGFLGHHVRLTNHQKYGLLSNAVIPKDRSQRFRERIKGTITTCRGSLNSLLESLNPVLRGWGNFYRFARGAKQVFSHLDWYIWHSILRWLRKRHPNTPTRKSLLGTVPRNEAADRSTGKIQNASSFSSRLSRSSDSGSTR